MEPRRVTEISITKLTRGLFLLLFLVISVSAAATEKERLFDFGISLAPNSEGSLESDAYLQINWFGYLQSSLQYGTASFSAVSADENSSETILIDQRVLQLTILETREKAFNTLLTKLNLNSLSFIDLRLGFFLKQLKKEEIRYGYSEIDQVQLTLDLKDLSYWKPLVFGKAGITMNNFNSHFLVEHSPLPLEEYTKGRFYSSPGMTEFNDYSVTDKGFETNYVVSAGYDIPQILYLTAELAYLDHVGYSIQYNLNDGNTVYAYQARHFSLALRGALNFLQTFGLAAVTPTLGVEFSRYDFLPVERYGVPGYRNSRFKFLIGLDYRI